MQRCCGITRGRARCSNGARYETTICNATFKVCKHHQNKRLLSGWEREISRRETVELPGQDEVPVDVERWVHLFHEGWDNTKNIYVSSNFATAIFRHPDIANYNFDKKHKLYTSIKLNSGPILDTCGICLEDRRVYRTECEHAFCKNCMQEWLLRATTCPQCRRIL
jgi:hypothetical protein